MLEAGFKTNDEVLITSAAPVFSLSRVIASRSARLLIALGVAVGLLYLVFLLPGLFLLVLPGEIAAIGKVYDEARLIRYLKYGEPMNPEYWEDTETTTEMIRIKASSNHDALEFSK